MRRVSVTALLGVLARRGPGHAARVSVAGLARPDS
ncbi:hypothetical protein H4W33_007410 [Kibdelosporangium phytohabitans]|nr:hypothetical protein [Kibdelosporangium phytohabitans]